ncbi:MAG: AAA family ATPase [Deltaproteobacteria bacterium]|jgi:CO dehydrogenase maturation factor|nr:AAA family ATPase [Deltaproteobacteria bacterium]MBW2535599.1 AAA family ATPase [Deltaproteobacteria bacterium]
MADGSRPIFAVCGKGGVGKTVVSALLGRALLDAGHQPLLLVDADPVGGLSAAIGERAVRTLGDVRRQVIERARSQGEDEKQRLADELDYMVLEALVERDQYGLLSIGRSDGRGCFCPVNTLLRSAIDVVTEPFAAVLIDAEAGIEQINREVTRRVTQVIAVTDGSARAAETISLIASLIGERALGVVANRGEAGALEALPEGAVPLGVFPEDDELRQLDRTGRPLWELDDRSPARRAARLLAERLLPGLGTHPCPP